MEAIKNLINILVAVYLLFAILVMFDIMGVTYFDSNFTRFNPGNFYYIMFIVGTVLLLLKLIIDLLFTVDLKRQRAQHLTKIDQLKAEIYDLKQDVRTAATGTTPPVTPITAPDHTLPPATDNPTMP